MGIFALLISLSAFGSASAHDRVWRMNGPYGEEVVSLAFDPLDSLLMYAGTGSVEIASPGGLGNGVYRTTDGGKTWEHTALDSAFIWDIEVDSRGNIYAATRGYGVFKSIDKGKTWYPVNSGLGCLYISCVVIDPLNDSILYVGTGDRYVGDCTGYCKDGIYKSVDGGQSWSQLAFDDMVIGAIAIDPTSPEIIYAGVYGDQDTSGIYKSVDGGQNWQKKYANVRTSAIAIDPINTDKVYAGICGLVRTTDGGETWSGCGVGPGELWTIAVDPLNSDIVYAGNAAYPCGEDYGELYRSVDGGKTWSEVMIGIPYQPVLCIAVNTKNPNSVYVGTQGPGVFKSVNKGEVWQWLSNGMAVQRVVGLAISLRDRTVFAATRGWTAHAGVYKSNDFGNSWFNSSSGIYQTATVCIAVALSAPNTVYLGTCNGIQGPFYRSFDGGTSWEECAEGHNCLATDITVNPFNAREFYLAYFNLYKSVDAGSTITVVLPCDTLTNAQVITVAIDPLDTNVVYVGGRACPAPYISVQPFVYKSTDGGSSWIDISEGLRYTAVQDLVVDPFDHNVIYAAVCSLDVGSFFRYNGNAWEERSEGLDGFCISSIAVDGYNPDYLYLGTKGGGVYRSTDGGIHWSTMNEGLTNLHVNYVIVDPTNPYRVYAGTDSGTYVITLPQGVANSKPRRPSNFYLYQNYPNPFSSETYIKFALSEEASVSLEIYDVTGRLIKTLVNKKMDAGYHSVKWDARDVSSGIYFCKIRVHADLETHTGFGRGNHTETSKMILTQ